MLHGCRLFKWGLNLPPGTVEQGYRLFKRCQFLPPEQVRWAELDILLYFYFRTYQVKPGHMQLLLLRSAFFFLLREIYSVRMSTSEFGSIILLNKESLHLISVDRVSLITPGHPRTPQDTPGHPRTHKYTQRYLYSIIFIMFLNQIRFIFIKCVIKSNISIKTLSMFV